MNYWIFLGSIFGGIGVIAGAFGGHALKTRLDAEMFMIFEVGVRYQIYHALALLFLGLMAMKWEHWSVQAAGMSFTTGIILFSGSLYILSLTGWKGVVAITPVGGLGFILGWSFLAWAALKA